MLSDPIKLSSDCAPTIEMTPRRKTLKQQTNILEEINEANDIFKMMVDLQSELKEITSEETFTKIQKYAIVSASAAVLKLGLNSQAQPS